MEVKFDDLEIFTTGAFLRPTSITVNGEEIWLWSVTEFTDDSYMDGNIFNPKDFGKNKEELLTEN